MIDQSETTIPEHHVGTLMQQAITRLDRFFIFYAIHVHFLKLSKHYYADNIICNQSKLIFRLLDATVALDT